MAQRGRATQYTESVGQAICERISQGEGVHQFAGRDGMPPERTIYGWLAAHESFQQMYARARERQADRLAAEIIEIADDGTTDRDEEGNINQEAVARSRLRVDARKWAASKLAPRKYGDKIEATHTGEVGLTVKIVKFGDA